MEEVIRMENLTKNFGKGRGIFKINLSVYSGEIFGLFGLKESGKTTIIEHLTGHVKSDIGYSLIYGMDTFKEAKKLKNFIKFIPEGSLFTNSGNPESLFDMAGQSLVTTKILILDEPFTGMNSYRKNLLTDIFNEAKNKGITVMITSQNYKELEGICDRITFLHNGKIINTVHKCLLNPDTSRYYRIGFHKKEEYDLFLDRNKYDLVSRNNGYKSVILSIDSNSCNLLFKDLEQYELRQIEFVPCTGTWYYSEELQSNLS